MMFQTPETIHNPSMKTPNQPQRVHGQPSSTESISLADVQRRVDEWIESVGVDYFSELTNLAQLVEEVGELARVMAREFGDQTAKPGENHSLAGEIGDVLFVLTCIANQTGVNMDEAFRATLRKNTLRDTQRHADNPKLLSRRHKRSLPADDE